MSVGRVAAPRSSLDDDIAALAASRPDALANRFSIYRRLQLEAPVLRLMNQVFVSRYSDVVARLGDPRLLNGSVGFRGSYEAAALAGVATEHRHQLESVLAYRDRWMSQLNGARHAVVRGLAHLSFTPAAVAELDDLIQQVADRLLDRLAKERRIELLSQFAYELPLTVVCDTLRIPVEDRAHLHRLSAAFAAFQGGTYLAAVPEMYESMLQLNDYLVGLFASRRKARAGGLLDRLLIAVDDPAIDFGEDELLSMVGQLIFAGHETTMHFIANAVHALLSRRALWDQLLENPALLAPGIEELLRLVSPSQFAARTAAEDLEIGDVKVARWETVRLLLGAANRDPDRFENPDEPEFGRPDSRHVAFGLGPHFCLGAALTRREATIALGTLLRRFPDLELLNSSVSLLPSFMFHGFTELWVQLP